jgi:hypothetical protein
MLWKAARVLALVLVSAMAGVPAGAQEQGLGGVTDSGFGFPTASPGAAWFLPAAPSGPSGIPSIVPEPATFALLAFSFLALRRRPR